MTAHARILVVDDSPTIRGFFAALLRQMGCDLTLAETSAQALDLLATSEFELVIADKNLEPEDGFTVCRAAKDRGGRFVGCAVVTGDTSVASAVRAVEEPIDLYLLKPLRREVVELKVEQALERVRLMRRTEEAQAELTAAKQALEQRTQELQGTLDQIVHMQHQLTESEKQASIGMLAAGVAHEINNPACFILPNLDYIKRTFRKLADRATEAGAPVEAVDADVAHGERMVDRCTEGLSRITRVVQTLRLFSRRELSPPDAVDIRAVCSSLLDLVSHELDGRAELQVDLQEVALVEGHKQSLAQVVLNLLLNARRSVFAGDRARAHRIQIQTTMRGREVLFVVEDSGPRLSADDSAGQALEPFFGGDLTSGPGLHLSLARDILHRHGGRLVLRCTDEGNRLEAYLPCTDAPRSADVEP